MKYISAFSVGGESCILGWLKSRFLVKKLIKKAITLIHVISFDNFVWPYNTIIKKNVDIFPSNKANNVDRQDYPAPILQAFHEAIYV